MNILVTGGCGFIGSHFLNEMVVKYPDYTFYNMDVMYYCASLENIDQSVREGNNYHFIKGNITDMDLVLHILEAHHITHIIHFAAQSHVDQSFDNSLAYTMDNVYGTHVLLEASRRVSARRSSSGMIDHNNNQKIVFLHFSTDEVYGESKLEEDPKHEQSLLCPTNPYAASKAAAEMFVTSYHHSFQLPIIMTRCNNVYGPRQYPEKLIPKCIDLLRRGKKVTIQGDGSALRSFIHVRDVVSAVDLILHQGQIGETYNIGSGMEHEASVMEIAKLLITKLKPELSSSDGSWEDWIEYIPDRPFNDKRYFITNEKIKKLGWIQTIGLQDGMDELLTTSC